MEAIGTALFFGSFNPVHNGHMAIAKAVTDRLLCEQLWFVVSPLNPLKDEAVVIDGLHRLEMVRLAVDEWGCGDRMAVSDVEFAMPTPSYTVDTLNVLSAEYPGRRFTLVLGSDNLRSFDRWKDYSQILDGYDIIVYPRRGCGVPEYLKGRITMLDDVPCLDISSTEIRAAILSGRPTGGMIPQSVGRYIVRNKLWV